MNALVLWNLLLNWVIIILFAGSDGESDSTLDQQENN